MGRVGGPCASSGYGRRFGERGGRTVRAPVEGRRPGPGGQVPALLWYASLRAVSLKASVGMGELSLAGW